MVLSCASRPGAVQPIDVEVFRFGDLQRHAAWFGGSMLASSPEFVKVGLHMSFQRAHSMAPFSGRKPLCCCVGLLSVTHLCERRTTSCRETSTWSVEPGEVAPPQDTAVEASVIQVEDAVTLQPHHACDDCLAAG